MNIGRAVEISQSGKKANVEYNGKTVQIQHVNEDKGTARIYSQSNPEDEKEVVVEMLVERS
ncbi:H-type small acid-soluble spore protein [Metabacillus herbersteinensis]|uniref:Small, acid-soluble spore protein H n=1 Tax=Metabacillus herbersteinensis TaxID=283816 RepID=A0ABV6GAM7_9BACI